MRGALAEIDQELDALDVFVFELQGTMVGLDREQISHMSSPDDTEGELFHLLAGFSEKEAQYTDPKIIHISGSDRAVVIDNPHDFYIVELAAIRAMPRLIGNTGPGGAFWGGFLLNGRIVLLCDLIRLIS
jgi:hypothetical protein